MSQAIAAVTRGLASEFAEAVGSLLNATPSAAPLQGSVAVAWAVPCRLDGPVPGTLYLGMPEADAGRLAARLRNSDAAGEAEISDALLELTTQAFGAMVSKQDVPGLAGEVGPPARVAEPATAPVGAFELPIDDALTIRLVGWFDTPAELAVARAAGRGADAGETAAPQAPGPGASGDNLELLLDIDMPLSVRFGEAVLTLEALARLSPGSLVELSRQPDDPVDVLINGRFVARGEVVVVAGNYGVRVTEVASAAERLRTING